MARAMPGRARLEELAVRAHYKVSKLSKLSGLHPRTLQRKCQRRFGRSARALLNEMKLRAAKADLLAEGSVERAARSARFKHASSFCRWFKNNTHSAPTEFLTRGT